MYTLIVGNIGTIGTYDSLVEAMKHYNEYVTQSKSGVGRAGDENVTIVDDSGDIVQEHYGINPYNEGR